MPARTNRYRPEAQQPNDLQPQDDSAYDVTGDGGDIIDPNAPPPAPDEAQGGAAPIGHSANLGPVQRTGSVGDEVMDNRQLAVNAGNAVDQTVVGDQNRYGANQQKAKAAGDSMAEEIRKQPGYSPDQQSKIGVDYGQFRTSQGDLNSRQLTDNEQNAIKGDPSHARGNLNPGLTTGIAKATTEQRYGDVANLQSGLKGAIDENALTQDAGSQAAQKGALSEEQASLAANNDRKNLALDPSFKGRQMSDQDVQDMTTAAGTTVGNKYRSGEDDIQRRAAAEGNTSPMAIAAAREQMERDSAADSGDAMTNARIAAKQAQFGRAQTIEGMRLGSEQDIANRGTQGAETLGQQKVAQSQLGEGQRLDAEKAKTGYKMNAAATGGQAEIDATNAAGATAMDAAKYNQDTGYAADKAADDTAASRAATVAGNRQATTKDIQDTGYSQGTQTAGANSQGAQTIGNANIAGRNTYLGYQQGQNSQGQQGEQTAVGQQIANNASTSGSLNNSTATQNANEHSLGVGQQMGMGIANMLFDEGDVITEPTMGIVGEDGPEAIVPAGGDADETNTDPSKAPPNAAQKPSAMKQFGQKMVNRYRAPGQQQQQTPDSYLPGSGFNWQSMGKNSGGGATGLGGIGKAAIGAGIAALGDGGVITKPTLVMLAEHGQPEAVVPLNHNRNAKVMPGMLNRNRYRA